MYDFERKFEELLDNDNCFEETVDPVDIYI